MISHLGGGGGWSGHNDPSYKTSPNTFDDAFGIVTEMNSRSSTVASVVAPHPQSSPLSESPTVDGALEATAAAGGASAATSGVALTQGEGGLRDHGVDRSSRHSTVVPAGAEEFSSSGGSSAAISGNTAPSLGMALTTS